jgi:hypothetical protein
MPKHFSLSAAVAGAEAIVISIAAAVAAIKLVCFMVNPRFFKLEIRKYQISRAWSSSLRWLKLSQRYPTILTDAAQIF